jgi:hypothetical protein
MTDDVLAQPDPHEPTDPNEPPPRITDVLAWFAGMRLPDGLCWCVSDEAYHEGWIHSPRCLEARQAASRSDALEVAATAVDALWDEPDPGTGDALEGKVWITDFEDDGSPPVFNAALRKLREALR